MSDERNDFTFLMGRLRQGDQQAATELYNRFHEAVIRVIRYRLNRYPRLRSQYDSFDASQSVWAYVFGHPEKLRDFAEFQDFLNYLLKVSNHKIERAQRKHLGTRKRDLRRTLYLSEEDVGVVAREVPDPLPSPVEQASTLEQWQRWFLSLRPRQRSVVLMLQRGHGHQEIADSLGYTVRTIERIIAIIRRSKPPDLII